MQWCRGGRRTHYICGWPECSRCGILENSFKKNSKKTWRQSQETKTINVKLWSQMCNKCLISPSLSSWNLQIILSGACVFLGCEYSWTTINLSNNPPLTAIRGYITKMYFSMVHGFAISSVEKVSLAVALWILCDLQLTLFYCRRTHLFFFFYLFYNSAQRKTDVMVLKAPFFYCH